MRARKAAPAVCHETVLVMGRRVRKVFLCTVLEPQGVRRTGTGHILSRARIALAALPLGTRLERFASSDTRYNNCVP